MSSILLLGLMIQLLSVLLVAAVIGRRHWLTHIGIMFPVMGFFFHGITEVVQQVFGGQNYYRLLVTQMQVDDWVLTVSFALLLFSIGYVTHYVLTGSDKSEGPAQPMIRPPLGWKVTLAAVLPLYLIALSLGAASGTDETKTDYFAGGFVDQFLVLGIILTAFSFLIQSEGRYFLRVLILQSVSLALLGQRLNVVVGVFVLLSLLARFRPTLRRSINGRHVIGALALTVLFVFAISAARVVTGRLGFAESPARRVVTLLSSVDIFSSESGSRSVMEDFLFRFDGNSLPALVDERLDSGFPPTDGVSFVNNFKATIPAFLWAGKADLAPETLNEEAYIVQHFAISATTDYVPTLLGTVFTYRGDAFLMIFSFSWGLLLSMFDRWVNRRRNLTAFVLTLWFSHAILYYEQTTQAYVGTIRGMIAIAVLFQVAVLFRRAFLGQPQIRQVPTSP